MIIKNPDEMLRLKKIFVEHQELNDTDFHILLCQNTGLNNFREFVYCKKRHIINRYSLSCSVKRKCIDFEVEIDLEQKEQYFILLLNKLFVLNTVYPANIIHTTIGNIIILENIAGFKQVKISYTFYSEEVEIYYPNSLWLIKPIDYWKILEFDIKKIDYPVLVSNAIKRNGEFNLAEICLLIDRIKGPIFYCNRQDRVAKITDKDAIIPDYFFVELKRYTNFYCHVMGEDKINIRFVGTKLPNNGCVSMPGLIVFNQSLLQNPHILLYTYFPHEINHQVIGNKLLFHGDGSLWIKESLTEYIQSLYWKERFKTSLYRNMIKKYADIYFKYNEFEIPISMINESVSNECYLCTIAGKGVLLFMYAFLETENPILLLQSLILELNNIGRKITLELFLSILAPKLSSKTFRNLIHYVYNLGVPCLEVI